VSEVRSERPRPGIGRERQFEIYVGGARGQRPGVPVSFDSGVRSGADVFRALAAGAHAVGLGRPYVWGLASGGEDGVREVIRNLRADFDLAVGLAGCASLAEIGPESLAPTRER